MRQSISLSENPTNGLLDRLLDGIRNLFSDPKPAERELADMTDEQLQDLGIEPGSVHRAVNIEPDRIGLLDLGWQVPRNHPRR